MERIHIVQVLFNLVRNAVEAMAGGARRSIMIATTLAAPHAVQVSIADTGSGLPERVRAKLFEPSSQPRPAVHLPGDRRIPWWSIAGGGQSRRRHCISCHSVDRREGGDRPTSGLTALQINWRLGFFTQSSSVALYLA
jgi:hypothetical protein